MDAKTKSPREGGLTLPGKWHYACFANWRMSKFSPVNGLVNLPLRLGLSGRGNYAQTGLKSRPGQPASRCAAYRREAQMATGAIR